MPIRFWHAVALMLVLIPTANLAQPPTKSARSSESDALFNNLDANKDGKLFLSEATDANRPMFGDIFRMASKDTSESVTRDEFEAVFQQRRRSMAANAGGTRPESAATNGPRSGGPMRFTRVELRRLLDDFDRVDRDNDGALSPDEMQAALNRGPGSAAPGRGGAMPRDEATKSTPGSRPTGTNPPARSKAASGARPSASRAPAGNSPLAGLWRGWVVNGRGENPNSGPMQMELFVEGNRMVARDLRGGDGLGEGVFEVAATGSSGTLDANGTSGQQAGKQFLGIFELNGDELRWCVGNQGRPRPRQFATNTGNYFMILRRQSQ